MAKTLLITVGTTQFDDLIQSCTTSVFYKFLEQQGYTRVILQYGRRSCPVVESTLLQVELYSIVPDLTYYMDQADVIISHAGAGTIFEALYRKKHLIVVTNPKLMDNHQIELCQGLADYLIYSMVDQLPDALLMARPTKMLAPPQTHLFTAFLQPLVDRLA